MYFGSFFDAFFLLGTLTGVPANPSVCTSGAAALPAVVYGGVLPMAGAPAETTAFVDVNVVPMDRERVLAHQTVLVEGGRITALGPVNKVKVPAGAVQIDGRGRYLIPGLSDMHQHGYPSTEAELREEQDRVSARLASGVTMIRDLGSIHHHLNPVNLEKAPSNPLTLEQVRRQFQAAKLPSPQLHVPPLLRTAAGLIPLDSLVAYLTAAKAAGYRHINVDMERDVRGRTTKTAVYFSTIVTAARQLGLPVTTHTHKPSPEEILALGSTGGSIEHLHVFWEGPQGKVQTAPSSPADTVMPLSKIQSTATGLRQAGVWVTPTLECHLRLGHPAYHPAMRRIVKTLQEVGVGMLLGLDSPGREVHDELRALVRAGLSPYQALLTGTRNPAAFYKMLDSAGTVAVGKRADLVLLYGNPLEDIRHAREPVGVMTAGRWLDRAALDRAVFTSPTAWLKSLVGLNPLDLSYDNEAHKAQLGALADSLEAVTPSDTALAERLRQQLTAALGVMRSSLTPEQHEFFDPIARVWLRAQARQGNPMTIPGLTPTP